MPDQNFFKIISKYIEPKMDQKRTKKSKTICKSLSNKNLENNFTEPKPDQNAGPKQHWGKNENTIGKN